MARKTEFNTHTLVSATWRSSLWWRMPLIGTALAIPLTGPASLFVAVYGSPAYGAFWTLFAGSLLVATSSVPLGAILVGVPFELLLIQRWEPSKLRTAVARCVAYAICGSLGGYLTFLAVSAWVLDVPPPDTLLPAILVSFPLCGAIIGVGYTLYEQYVRQMHASARMSQELAVAHTIQRDLFPQGFPQMNGLAFAANCTPARETGGDFYDLIYLEHGRVGVVVADVAGKSIAAALLMANARSIWRAAAATGASPKVVLERANRALCQDIRSSAFVTLFYAIIDMAGPGMHFASAGHPPALLCHPRPQPAQQSVEVRYSLRELSTNGLPLGLVPDAKYEETSVSLLPGDRIILYTDGLVESLNAQREMFGFERLNDTLARLTVDQPQAIIEKTLNAIRQFRGPAEQVDDVTILIVQLEKPRP